jgi:hypothetical protein
VTDSYIVKQIVTFFLIRRARITEDVIDRLVVPVDKKQNTVGVATKRNLTIPSPFPTYSRLNGVQI